MKREELNLAGQNQMDINSARDEWLEVANKADNLRW